MFAENSPIVHYNELMLNETDGQTISLSAIDDIPHEVQLSDKQLETIMEKSLETLEIYQMLGSLNFFIIRGGAYCWENFNRVFTVFFF